MKDLSLFFCKFIFLKTIKIKLEVKKTEGTQGLVVILTVLYTWVSKNRKIELLKIIHKTF